MFKNKHPRFIINLMIFPTIIQICWYIQLPKISNHHKHTRLFLPWLFAPLMCLPKFPHKNVASNILDLVLEGLLMPSQGCHGRRWKPSRRWWPLAADSKRWFPNDDLCRCLASRGQGKKRVDIHSRQADVLFADHKQICFEYPMVGWENWMRLLRVINFT